MKRLLIIALAIGLSVGMALPAKSASDKPKRGGTLTFAVRKEIRIKNPLVRTRSIDNWIRRLMFEPLLTVDTKGKVHPTLAESWEVSDNYKLYTFRIRTLAFLIGLKTTLSR